MDLGLHGATALVTAASKGIGFACATRLASEGARLVMFSRPGESLEASAAQIREEFGAEVITHGGDLRSSTDLAALRRTVLARFGPPDVIILNLGLTPLPLREVLAENEDDRWLQAHDALVLPTVRLLGGIVPAMVERGRGRIISVTSASAKAPMSVHGLSTVYRAGQAGYLKHLANEVAASGVTVNSVGVASIATDTFLRNVDPAKRARSVPVGRLAAPDEVASLIAYLASDLAGFITGQHIQFDGGQTTSLF
jgi:3-oxoacyl-[acyl-carrier protein] reductase